jgi:CspA family cold shock protein
MEGTIKNIVEGKDFGFISVDGEERDLFFHKSELQGVSLDELKRGDRVSFEKGETPKGPNAVNVTRA